jgi:hypothetical protein
LDNDEGIIRSNRRRNMKENVGGRDIAPRLGVITDKEGKVEI